MLIYFLIFCQCLIIELSKAHCINVNMNMLVQDNSRDINCKIASCAHTYTNIYERSTHILTNAYTPEYGKGGDGRRLNHILQFYEHIRSNSIS